MKRVFFVATLVLAIFASTFIWGNHQVLSQQSVRYAVTLTNLTRGQNLTAPAIIVHNQNFQLFALGAPAPEYLAPLAEDGSTSPLLTFAGNLRAGANGSVFEAKSSAGGGPGVSSIFEITAAGEFKLLSLAGMLATTNDAFYAIRGILLPEQGSITLFAEAYDAGTERNSESCQFVPGPPCGAHGKRDATGAEGFVYVHAGIHGIADLPAAIYDWRNPVAQVVITRLQ
jgi:hypothetical protein